MASLAKDGEYILMIENESNAVIKVTKDSDVKNLIGNEKAIKIEEQVLSKDKEDAGYYHIGVVSNDGVKNSDKLNISVEC